MKSLRHYIEDKTTALFDELGIFFAFNQSQVDEGLAKHDPDRKRGKYSVLPGNMLCPNKHVDEFIERYDKLLSDGIAEDIAENGAYNIIQRELDNHEFGYTGEIEPTFDALKGYGFSLEQVKAASRGKNWYLAKGFS